MADLIATSATAGHLPVCIGTLRLTDAPVTPIWSIAPFHGQVAAVSRMLDAAHGLPFPSPDALHDADGARIAWSGMEQAFMIGAVPDAGIAGHAALSDQSDGWAHLTLKGEDARAVLARLVPVDLSTATCPPGSARRTLLGHMPVLILHSGGDRFDLLVFRSMVGTAVHELTRVMTAVLARAAIAPQDPV